MEKMKDKKNIKCYDISLQAYHWYTKSAQDYNYY